MTNFVKICQLTISEPAESPGVFVKTTLACSSKIPRQRLVATQGETEQGRGIHAFRSENSGADRPAGLAR